MSRKRLIQELMVITLLSTILLTNRMTLAAEPVVAQMEFITHIAADLAEQHVYIESSDNPEQVVRVKGEAATAAMAQPVYASATATETDFLELGPNPFGPFPKGEALGFTLEEWLAATGNGTYTLNGDMAELNFTFQNLVPNGVYTMWCSRLTLAPTFAEDLHPCGAQDGSQNTFVADAQGNGSFNVTMPAMPASSEDIISDIAVAYHSDGQTYGSSPGDFGRVTHVQLFVAEPPPALESAPASLPTTGGVRGDSTTVWLMLMIGAFLVGIGWYLRKKVA